MSPKLLVKLRYWLYRKIREPRAMMAYLLARKRFRPTAFFSIVVPCRGVSLMTLLESAAQDSDLKTIAHPSVVIHLPFVLYHVRKRRLNDQPSLWSDQPSGEL